MGELCYCSSILAEYRSNGRPASERLRCVSFIITLLLSMDHGSGPRPLSPIHKTALNQIIQDQACVFLLRACDCIQRNLRLERGFIGIVNPCKALKQPLTRFSIQSLWVSLLADLYGSIDIDLDEAAFFHHMAHLIANCQIGADCRTYDKAAMTHDFRCYETNAPYVHVAVFFAESQSFGQMSANHITIQHRHPAALPED